MSLQLGWIQKQIIEIRELIRTLSKKHTVILSSHILAEVREHGYVTASAAARLVGMYMQAVSDGADAILNCCSSVGEVADAAQNIGRYTGIPIVRIDEEMCREAARLGKRVGVLATLPTTWSLPRIPSPVLQEK